MASKALITRRGAPASEAAAALESDDAAGQGVTVDYRLAAGAVVSLDDENRARELEQRGFRVKMLPDSNLLQVGSYRIDTQEGTETVRTELDPHVGFAAEADAGPAVPPALEVPAARANEWTHHLAQLDGPRAPEWIEQIRQQGVEVVEPISNYGLFLHGSPAAVAAVQNLPFVNWTGPFKPAYRIAPNLTGLTGRIQYVRVEIYPPSEEAAVKQELARLGAYVVREARPTGNAGDYATLIAEIDAQNLRALAQHPAVRSLEYAPSRPGLDGEVETQIVAENLVSGAPVTGYDPFLRNVVELTGADVVVAICDTGVSENSNNNASGHLDLRGRQAAFVDYTGGSITRDLNGHGTHVGGIAVGNNGSGKFDGPAPNDFRTGQGVAPDARFVGMNALELSPWPPAKWRQFTEDATNGGAHVMNNSWFDGGSPGSGYTAGSREFDQLVRDPQWRDPTDNVDAVRPLTIVFSAGNAGPGARTITPPKEAKNIITVGNSHTHRPTLGLNNINDLADSSSRGPAVDGRILPNVVAPGTQVTSARNGTTNGHVRLTGTSMAAPHVAGVCALLIEWWRGREGGEPSPAMLKALLINGAEDMRGGDDGLGGTLGPIPNTHQGWGRVSISNIVRDHPGSDRGPRICKDQLNPFTATGQEELIRVRPADTGRPMRVTLVWSDAPGAANANPALVNDLDLEVVETATGTVFKGNVFQNGFSITGGNFDNLNNIECVYVQNPQGDYEIRVIGSSITANARPPFDTVSWQDYALVIDNAVEAATT